MKKIMLFIIGLIAIVIVVVVIVGQGKTTVVIDLPAQGQMVFRYKDSDIQKTLSNEELSLVYDMFSGKPIYDDNPSCGFSDSVAIIINSETFCIACDSCGIVYWKEKDGYFTLTESENSTLRAMLNEHGFKFPCI